MALPLGTFGGGAGRGRLLYAGNGGSTAPKTTITKDVSRVASGNSNQVIAIAGTASDDDVTIDSPSAVVVHNTGQFPVIAMLGYESYSDEDTDAGVVYIHALLKPGESIIPPMSAIIPTANHLHLFAADGDVIDFTAPNANLYTDSTADVDHAEASTIGSDATHTTLNLESGHSNFLRVGDLIRLEDEICEVTAVGTGADLANSTATIIRGVHGSTAATHADDVAVRLPFFNQHYDFDRALQGSSQLVSTDARGRFKASNFFGYGRSSSGNFGLVPGTICLRFYTKAYQSVMMGGTGVAGGTGVSNIPITSSTDSKLTASTAYAFNLTIDDSAATTVSFTVDSDNTRFGGTSGIISKVNDAILTATRTVGNALFGYSCTVSIVDGSLRFTSNSHLAPHDGTNGSKVLLADAGSGTNVFSGAAGIFPDIALVNAPVAPKLPDLNLYDPITYATSRNMDRICYDDSNGRLTGFASGTINYETGAIDMINAPANAQFEVSLTQNSIFGGRLDANIADANTLQSVYANTLSKNMVSTIKVDTY